MDIRKLEATLSAFVLLDDKNGIAKALAEYRKQQKPKRPWGPEQEAQHPRAADGKFGSGGSKPAKTKPTVELAKKRANETIDNLMKDGQARKNLAQALFKRYGANLSKPFNPTGDFTVLDESAYLIKVTYYKVGGQKSTANIAYIWDDKQQAYAVDI